MSQWNPNYERPFDEGHNEYNTPDTYNNPMYNNATDPYYNQNSFYNYGQYPQQNYNSASSSVNYPLPENRTDTGNSYPSSSNFNASSNHYGEGSYTSSIVLNSNLTPLAKEFKPMNSIPVESGSNTSNKQGAGAVKKATYWNRDRNARRVDHRQFNTPEHEGRQNFRYNRNRDVQNFHPANGGRNYGNQFKDFNRSSEQNKIVQETKEFLKQVKQIEGNKEKNIQQESKTQNSTTYKNDTTSGKNSRSSANPDRFHKNNYSRNAYGNRGKSHKNSYNKRDSNTYYDSKSKEYQGNDRREENDYKVGERKQESFNERKLTDEIENDRKPNRTKLQKTLDAASQRERLEQLITRRLLECLVCCEKLRHSDQIWSCKQCYHILHLQCIKRWAQSSKLEMGWRCPACQNVYQDIPDGYRCYCNKQISPVLEPGGMPHSCGEVCGRKGRACTHSCTLICHPGPCPDCNVMVPRSCGCGATRPTVKCSSAVPIVCQNVCNKLLNCDFHRCTKNCHVGDCDPCNEIVKQECYCGKVGRKTKCDRDARASANYECGEICDKLLSCGNHRCKRNCHAGPCDDCPLDPTQVKTCPCGQTKLKEQRSSCLDPIPCCEKVCNKKLVCGQPSAPHFCVVPCHEGPCPPCTRTTVMRCRCGHMDKEIPCSKVTTKADDARCEKKCTKKRLCSKHKCNQLCCIEVDHVCPLICNRPLSCGQHRCEEPCHKGRCPPCWRTSFEELYCECGSSVLYPPVACGTRPPPCDQPCSRIRPCGHDTLHNCHTGPCPPCTILSKRWCHGQHEQRAAIPCHQEHFSCGLPCGRDLPCGRHKCVQPCHADSCKIPCTQPCAEIRSVCGHPCNAPCHDPPCPETSCKQTVKVTCQCGLRKSSRVCMELAGEYQSIAMSQLASKMEEMQMGHAVDITDIISGQKKSTLKTLECNNECRIVERNRRLAIGLQIRNPDLSAKLTPRYSDFMRTWAKKDPKFCQHIHDKLSELVQLAKQSKQKSRSYSFETMNRDKRHFVHEYCEHFGCESAAYDPEPHRNVVATGFRDKSWLPSYSLLEVIQRESGQRKVPGPQQLSKVVATKTEAVSLKLPGRNTERPSTPPGEYVDYFDNPPQ